MHDITIDTTEVFWDTDSDPTNPGWLMDIMPLGKIPLCPKHYHLPRSASDKQLQKAVRDTIRNEGYRVGRPLHVEIWRES